ncbi:helix-turn-helix domain-containing protein [Methyloceanibacter sp.]|uniref:MerR family transcriptional regulator n=1 Tax=Methyloceanibacter sp. TaxID=1965321 RepID=UPI002CBBA268|nr:helix-turn-helix domain-containing protein [Methyloceanibacter sp.]HML93014.1 helix-turn-helix domain-containing protein [Methyloceanibacter sp.]
MIEDELPTPYSDYRLKCEKLMLIGKLAAHTGVNIQTIRYYERLGLLAAAPRTKGGYRVYDHEHVRRLTFIRRSRELGFSLENVRSLLELSDSNRDCAAKELTLRQLEIVQGKIANLRQLEKALKTMAEACKPGAQESCPIFSALSDQV